MRSLSSTEMGYIAGILDADGYLGISKIKRDNFRGFNYRPVIDVTMISKLVPDYLHCTTELGNVYGPIIKKSTPKYDRSNERPTYRWYVTGTQVVPLLTSVKDIMILKRDRAEIMIEFQTLLTDLWKIRKPKDRHEERFTSLFSQLKSKNHRGTIA